MGKITDTLGLLVRTLRRFISLSFILAGIILFVRLYEMVITSNYYSYPPGSFSSLLLGIKYDIILYLRVSAVLMIPFLLLGLFSQKAARVFFISASVFLVLGDMLLLKYFSTAGVPLGADLFAYSIEEINQTVQSSGEMNVWPFIFMALFLVYIVRVFIKHVYYKLKPWTLLIISAVMFTSLAPLGFLKPQPSDFENEFSLYAATNKLNFFSESVLKRYVFNEQLDNQTYTFKTKVATADGSFTYLDEDYPFLHNETTPDVLGKYFEPLETKPNIVFIIVESLGRAYSGESAYLGSFTPFLDSLMDKSLYWENNLSTSGRTFEVLPSTLASVPFGDRGFTELGEDMPDHLSLISILKTQANYTSSFIYGGEAHFDNMDIFLKRQGIDKIIDNTNFGTGYKKMPPSATSGFSWGFGDNEIFRRYIDEIKADTASPRMDIILTLAIHSPFVVANQEYYISKFNERLEELELSEKTKNFNRNYQQQFSTVLYFDDALRYFFSEFRKLPSFNNTIFVITGDHRMPEVPISTQLDRFHVPLVIYSPMIKKPAKFSSVVTHFDITPSLLAMLDADSIISRPKAAAWIGHGLDDTEDFRVANAYPLMRNKNEILDFIDGERMLANKVIYQVYENMNIETVDEPDREKELETKLNNFLLKNNHAIKNNKLIPDSLKVYTYRGQ
ncbi:LTA synthase family protein [Draconibacterium halophilum]|uniref:Sulfatase-like hydrolase/transferase n=1 Tax=Draconibacterium halophilum TaxID=2706887 RepID=A0A6C0RHT4_9BACT|nr:alkaline phosphatase family protein [Draconibacterium halophilum]QIA08651.1 sulfatase-like hydrolase/transferase [Draconibacterium halophilum]